MKGSPGPRVFKAPGEGRTLHGGAGRGLLSVKIVVHPAFCNADRLERGVLLIGNLRAHSHSS